MRQRCCIQPWRDAGRRSRIHDRHAGSPRTGPEANRIVLPGGNWRHLGPVGAVGQGREMEQRLLVNSAPGSSLLPDG